MISVVIPTLDAELTLGPALGGLTKAAIEGLVKEVIVVDAGSADATLEIADDAGADIVRLDGDIGARLAAGAAQARSPWILTLRQGARVLPGWEVVVQRHIEASPEKAAWFSLKGASWLSRLKGPSDGAALLTPRRLYDASGGFAPGSAEKRLARKLGARRLAVPVLPPER